MQLYAGDLHSLAQAQLDRDVIAAEAGNAGASTLYRLFNQKAPGALLNHLRRDAPELVAADPPPGPVESLVIEAKVTAFWPYRAAWQAALAELGPVDPLFAAESLVRVVCEWAARDPKLAASLEFGPPVAAVEDLMILAESSHRDIPGLSRVLAKAIECAVDNSDVSALAVLEVVRNDLVAAGFPARVDTMDRRPKPEMLLAAAEHVLAGMSTDERRAAAPELRRRWAAVDALLAGGIPPHATPPPDLRSPANPSTDAGVGHRPASLPPAGEPGDCWPRNGRADWAQFGVGTPSSAPRTRWKDAKNDAVNRAPDEARTLAEVQTLLHHTACGGDPLEAEKILVDKLRKFPASNQVAFQVECALEELRSRRRPAGRSAAAWTQLRERAEAVLGPDNRTVMSMRAYETRYATLSGDFAALDAAVGAWRTAMEHRIRVLGPDAYGTRMGRVNYAKAVRERNRPGDLELARALLQEEADSAARSFLGPRHPFTLTVQAILAYTLIRIAEEAGPPACDAPAAEAEALTRSLVEARKERFGPVQAPTLRARLLHAHALLLLGRAHDAAGEIGYVMVFAPDARPALDPGWPEYLLARSLADDDRDRALEAANVCLRLRQEYFTPGSRDIMEAERLVAELSGGVN